MVPILFMLLKVHVYGKELLKTVSGPHFLFDKNWIDWCFTYACEYFTHIWSSQQELLKGRKMKGILSTYDFWAENMIIMQQLMN